MKSDGEIARGAVAVPIRDIAASLGLGDDDLYCHGPYMAKITPPALDRCCGSNPGGKLVLVTAMTPTPAGEGKTTTTIGLGQALQRIGRRALVAIREPSLGPCFGVKGGGAGGGYSQVLPMEEIKLHFTGDIHAVSTAHNLLAALVDNHLHHRLEPALHPRKTVWKRVIDMNDRTLRSIILGIDGGGANGVMREDGFEITAASEIMAILCLSSSLGELKERIAAIIVGYDDAGRPVRAADVGGVGAVVALLKHALLPNLVQSIEGTGVLVHGGPFANIAHGCNSVIATRFALSLGEFVVTEAGFGADLGAEKFFDIKCRMAGLCAGAAVLVVTRRAVALHGIANVVRHARNLSRFAVPVVVSINRFAGDREQDLALIREQCRDAGVDAHITDFRESGGAGGEGLAHSVASLCSTEATTVPLYDLALPLEGKIEVLAQMYGASGVEYTVAGRRQLKRIQELGFAQLPVCMAKTPASFTDDPTIPGSPDGFAITVSGARVSAGAGFVVVYCGNVMTMPGLPRTPAALSISLDDEGNISGLF